MSEQSQWRTTRQKSPVMLVNLSVIRSEDDTPIAYVGDTRHDRLIAAALEMREALRNLVNWGDSIPQTFDRNYHHWLRDWKQAKQAIMDATGEEESK